MSGGGEGSDTNSNASQGRGARSHDSCDSGPLSFSDSRRPNEADSEIEAPAVSRDDEQATPGNEEEDDLNPETVDMEELGRKEEEKDRLYKERVLRQQILGALSAMLDNLEIEKLLDKEGLSTRSIRPTFVLSHFPDVMELRGGPIDNWIDFGHVSKKIQAGKYPKFTDFIGDIRLLSSNMLKIFGNGHEYYQCAKLIEVSS